MCCFGAGDEIQGGDSDRGLRLHVVPPLLEVGGGGVVGIAPSRSKQSLSETGIPHSGLLCNFSNACSESNFSAPCIDHASSRARYTFFPALEFARARAVSIISSDFKMSA